MTFGHALGQTWRQALLFGVVFVFIALGLDAITGREVGWNTRGVTAGLATALYWLLSAWLLKRRQG